MVYADFESILKPVNEDVDVDPDFSQPLIMYRGEDAAEKFVRKLQLKAKQLCEEYIVTPKPILCTMTDSLSFLTTCQICTK